MFIKSLVVAASVLSAPAFADYSAFKINMLNDSQEKALEENYYETIIHETPDVIRDYINTLYASTPSARDSFLRVLEKADPNQKVKMRLKIQASPEQIRALAEGLDLSDALGVNGGAGDPRIEVAVVCEIEVEHTVENGGNGSAGGSGLIFSGEASAGANKKETAKATIKTMLPPDDCAALQEKMSLNAAERARDRAERSSRSSGGARSGPGDRRSPVHGPN